MEKFFFRTSGNIWKIATGQGKDYTTGCLIDCPYFKKYKLIAIDLSKQQKLDAIQQAIQQIDFTGNLVEDRNEQYFSLLKKQKKAFEIFHKELGEYFEFILLSYQYKMAQHNTLNVKSSNSQLNKLKSGIQNGAEVTVNLSSNVISDSNDDYNFPCKLLTGTQVLRLLQMAHQAI